MAGWMVSCVALYHCLFLVQATIKCNCNTSHCHGKNSTTCIAKYACYAEMFNGTAKYGCLHQVGYSSLCVRQGMHTKEHVDRPYLLTCCYRRLCNTLIKGNKVKVKPTARVRQIKNKRKGILIPEELQPLGDVSVKVLSTICAGGLFILILIIACAVHLLCYDDRTKNDIDLPQSNSVPVLGNSSLV